MGDRPVMRPASAATATVVPPAAPAAHSVLHSKILPLGGFAALLIVAASLILLMPSGAGNSALKCYDRGGNAEPCGTHASAAPARFSGSTAQVRRPLGWIASALYQLAAERPGWETAAVDPPVNATANAPVNSAANAPAARRSGRKHLASVCGRRLMPCFFSAVRRGITHLASAAGTMGQTRQAREHL